MNPYVGTSRDPGKRGTVRSRGVELIGPEEGELAEGEVGLGRMSEPATIFARCQELLGENGASKGRGSWSVQAEPGSRSTPSGISGTGRAAGWASQSRERRSGAAPT